MYVCVCPPQSVCVFSYFECTVVCVFVSITPERHKRLMHCHESTASIVRDCVPQSCDEAVCV